MQSLARTCTPAAAVLAFALAACSKDSTPTEPGGDGGNLIPASCPGINLGPAPARLTLTPASPTPMRVMGNGLDTVRYSGEIAVRGNLAYMSSWGGRRATG